jgi:hypothetical protein
VAVLYLFCGWPASSGMEGMGGESEREREREIERERDIERKRERKRE